MNELLKRLEHLSPEKRELVLKKLRAQKASASTSREGTGKAPIVPVSREEPIPLSFAQARLWFLDQLEGGKSAVYNVPRFLRLTGALQVAALEEAIAAIVQRHEVLRTTFSVINESPVQVVAPISDCAHLIALPVVDLQALPAGEREAEVQRLANEELLRPFDLANGPLLRVTLLRLASDSHVLLLVMHHIVCDGWSLGVFTRELSALYNAFWGGATARDCPGATARDCPGATARDCPYPLPALPFQYADFAHWQRQWLSGEVLERQLSYWREQLAGVPPLLELPTDRPRPSVQSFQGRSEYFDLDQTLTQHLKHLSQQAGTTLFMTLHAAFAILLSRYSRQEDIVIGSPIANRNRRELEPLIGFFVNTLVLRSNLAGTPTFLELLARVRQVALDGYAHQDLPFEKLVEELQVERTLSHNPLFQVMFVLQNAPKEEAAAALRGVSLTPLAWENRTTMFDLTLTLKESEPGLTGIWDYNSDLFESETIQRMSGHFEVLLNAIVKSPQQPISTLPLLTTAEIEQLQAWNATERDYASAQTIVELFEQQVAKRPNQIAVVFGAQQLTYRQLNQQANQLAHYLIRIISKSDHIQPDTLIGICVERSIEMVIGLLGILKAGGAYVPIDPNYPQERIRFMLEDSAAPVLLTQRQLKSQLPLDNRCQVLCLDEHIFTEQSTANPTRQSQAHELAYVIYTSGSTGQPKGVMVEHRHVMAMLQGYERLAPPTEELAGSSVSPFSFDVFVWECFSNLCFGRCLHILPTEKVAQPNELAAYLAHQKITQTYLPPAILEAVVEYFEEQANMPLQRLLVGVEPIPEGLLQRFRDLSPTLSIVNGYGPTETTVYATLYDFQSARHPCRRTPIGRAVANYEVYLCDAHLQPVPVGIPGEILIGGAAVSRGYLNRPELTADKFIELDLFGKRKRLYKTGDLAKWLPDGNIQFLGRVDHQIKLRGFRIELGEIESVLAQHESVKEVVVTVYEAEGNKRLVAYVAADSTADLDSMIAAELKSHLKARLPDYMIPSQIIVLEALPLSPNGKIDRKALPAPKGRPSTGSGSDSTGSGSESQKPVTPTEELLATLWAQVLKQESIGRHDNFFELGGHSLLATQLVTRIRDRFGVALPVRAIFESPQLSDLANHLDLYGWASSNMEPVGDLSEEEEEFEL